MKENEAYFLAMVAIGVFSVDEAGKIWRHKRLYGGSHKKTPAQWKTCALIKRAETSRASYKTVMFTVSGKRMKIYAHRIVWMIDNAEDIPVGMEVNHKDGIKINNHPENLEILTRSENTIHSFRELPRKKKAQQGEANSASKLTKQDVLEIRKLCRKEEIPQSKIAKMFGVVQATISAIHVGKSWKHLIGD